MCILQNDNTALLNMLGNKYCFECGGSVVATFITTDAVVIKHL